VVGRDAGVSHDIGDEFLMARAFETPFDDLEPFTVLRPEEIAADAAAWWKDNAVVRLEPERSRPDPPTDGVPGASWSATPASLVAFARGSDDRLPLPPRSQLY
jgi:hypothetical protein